MLEIFSKQMFFSQFVQIPVNIFKRFPLVIVASVVFTVSGILVVIDFEFSNKIYRLIESLLCTVCIGLPLLTALALVSETFNQMLKRALLQCAGVAALLLYFFTRPESPVSATDGTQIFLLTFAAYLLLLAPGVWYKFDSDKIWFWGKILVSRFLITFLYGVILFAGLTAALAATYFLFDLRFDLEPWIMSAWFMVVGIFGVWYFLIGMPLRCEYIQLSPYPKIIQKLFYGILLPFLVLFTVILYVYVGKALYTWTWPKDGVAQWVLGYIGFGLGCFLIAHPLIKAGSRLRSFFLKIFLLFIPLFAVLFLGIGLRVAEYGFTINRLLVVLSGFWMLGVVIYVLSTWLKTKIVYIPLSLSALCLVFSIGPWSIFNIAANSQISRVEKLLAENGLLANGQLTHSASSSVSMADQGEIIDILQYLGKYHHLRGRRAWIDQLASNSMDYYDLDSLVIQYFEWQQQ